MPNCQSRVPREFGGGFALPAPDAAPSSRFSTRRRRDWLLRPPTAGMRSCMVGATGSEWPTTRRCRPLGKDSTGLGPIPAVAIFGGSGTVTVGDSDSFTPSASPRGPGAFLSVFAVMTSVVASGQLISVSMTTVFMLDPALKTAPSITSSTPMRVARRRRKALASKVATSPSTSNRADSFGRDVDASASLGPIRARGPEGAGAVGSAAAGGCSACSPW